MIRRHVLVSGMNYKTGEPHRMSWTDAEIRAAGLVLIVHANGRYQLGTPTPANWNMTQVAYHLEGIARQIRTDAEYLNERQAKMTTPEPNRRRLTGQARLQAHLDKSQVRGLTHGIALALLLGIYLAAVILSGYQISVLIAGGLVLLVATLLADRSRRADHRETDRLMDEEILREFGPWRKP